MAENQVRRRLAAILAADVVGFSRLMQDDEAGTLADLRQRRADVLVPLVARHFGRIVKVMGDGVLVEFASAVAAVQCAADLQRGFAGANAGVAEARKIVLRIGVNLGDIVVEGSDIYGDGVNIAARLESMAQPGGICISAKVHAEVRGKVDIGFVDHGAQVLKNIASPVLVFHALVQPREAAGVTGVAGGADPAPPQRPSVAVLPFRGLPEGGEAALYGEGIAEEIIVELAREAGLLVLAGASSFQTDLAGAEHGAIAAKLGVGFLVTGSVRVLGDRIRVTVQLIDAASGRAAWAERFDRDLRDVFAIQTEIARTITATVVGRISAAEADAAEVRPFESLQAAALVAQGQRHFLAFTKGDLEAAIGCFQRAVALDANFARAWGLLAMARIYLRWMFELRANVEDILPVAERSVLLDARDAKGHCALGLCNLVLRRFEKAAHHFELGLKANPNDDLLLVEYGRFLIYDDRPDLALAKVREAMRLNPFHPGYYWFLEARCLHALGRYVETVAAFSRIENPPFWTYAYLEMCQRTLGNEAAAQAARATYLLLAPSQDLERFRATFPYRNPETAERFFASLALEG